MYTCGERMEGGQLVKVPLQRPYKHDVNIGDVLGNFNKFNWLFKNNHYGKTLAEITLKARTYAHGTIEYDEIKEQLPGYTWCGTVKMVEDYDYDNQEMYIKRARRLKENIIPNGLVCLEFDEIYHKDIDDYINKIKTKFNHIIYAGRTLSDSLFVMHRADSNLTNDNFAEYFMTLAVMYYNDIGIKCDKSCIDISRMRYICDQMRKGVASMTYCDFSPIENIKVEYDKIFKEKRNDNSCVTRKGSYEITPDDTIYDYDENKGFYYGHMKQHKHSMGDIIVSVPSIEQIINTLIALGKTCDEIIEFWKTSLNYYNYRTNNNNVDDNIRLTKKMCAEDREHNIGSQVYNFLRMFFPKIIGIEYFFLDSQEFLCDRHYDMLVDSIMRYNRILVHGDTGIGKTHFINKIGENKDVIVVVPYIAHMGNYPNFEQVEIKRENDMLKSGVVIWDRFVKLYDMRLISDKSIIIIDESHKLFLDQTYRDAAINMNRILTKITNKICYMSATPINEIDVDITYRFEKERNKVTVTHFKIVPEETTPVNSSLTINAILHLLYGNINYYDRIFIASDRYAQKIYDRLYGRFDCQLIRASQKDSFEFRKLMVEQTLEHKIIIGTCISYESLNFNNKDEKILTITDMNEKTTAQVITQIAGRVRFSYNRVYLVESLIKMAENDYTELADFYNEIEKIKVNYDMYTRKHYVQKHAEELEQVKEWYFENNNIDVIKDNLPTYIEWNETEILAHQLIDKSPLNEQVKKYIIDYVTNHIDENFDDVAIVINGDTATYDFFGIDYINITEEGQAAYIIQGNIHDIQYSYRKLCSYVGFRKVNELIVESHTLPKGVNKEIFDIMDVIKLTEDKYERLIVDLETYLNTLHDNYYHMLERQIKKIKDNRKIYYECFCGIEDKTYKSVFDKYLDIKIKKYLKRIKINTESGKIGKTVIITDVMSQSMLDKYGLKIGEIFDSCTALAKKCGVNNGTITRWKKDKKVAEK